LAAVYTPRKERVGTAMVLASATGFGTLSILAKLGYEAGLGTQQMLAFRFVVAAIGMVGLAALAGQNPLLLGRTRLLTLLSMGALFYSAQSLTYFLALRTLSASVVVLIAYIYPSLVVLAGWLFLRRKVTAKHGAALAASFLGLAMLVGGVAHFQLTWALLLALASPIVYTGYILLGETVMGSVPALAASAVIMVGAAIGFGSIAFVTHELRLPVTLGGWAVVAALAVLPTMLAITLFLGGLPRVGASRAALLSTWEPVVTVMLAAVLLGDRLSVVQVIGGLLVLLAVVVVQGAQLWRPEPR
jgi:drug/metabolite transporter (DMT)-like permease